jgi:hypothetical protein
VYNPLDVWTPHLDLWQRVLQLRDDLVLPVRVVKVKAHQTQKVAETSPKLRWEKVGNDLADARAKLWSASAEHPQALLDRIAKAEALVLMLGRYFSQAVHLALKHGCLVERDALPPGFRIRPCTQHLIASWPGGGMRCVRCFRVQGECIGHQAPVCSTGGRRHLPIFRAGGGLLRAVRSLFVREDHAAHGVLPRQAG